MKKTEKIEVRVSAEEKERLSAMADQRGQSISDLIRDSLHSDVVSARSYPKWPGAAAVGALCLAGLALFLPFQMPIEADRTGSLYIRSTDGYIEIETALPLDVQHSDVLNFSSGEQQYKLSIDVSQPGNGTAQAVFNLCQQTEEECFPMNLEDLVLPIRPPQNENFSVRAKSGSGEALFDVKVRIPEYNALPSSKD